MSINEAAVELKKIEVVENQIRFLQNEARRMAHAEYGDSAYANLCNEKANNLILRVLKNEHV